MKNKIKILVQLFSHALHKLFSTMLNEKSVTLIKGSLSTRLKIKEQFIQCYNTVFIQGHTQHKAEINSSLSL